MKTIKGGIADLHGIRYSANTDTIARNSEESVSMLGLTTFPHHAFENSPLEERQLSCPDSRIHPKDVRD